MSRAAGLFLLALLSLNFGSLAKAQSLRIQSTVPHTDAADIEPWSGFVRYSALTDYAETEQPRVYTQSLRAGTGYKFNENWSVSGDFSVRAETINGQIDKSREQSYAETLNPSAALELDYDHVFMESHSYTFFVHGEPLLDEPSRNEGYKAIYGGGASLSLGFLGKRFVQEHVLDASELVNTFKYAIDTTANPDTFYTYKIDNSVRLYKSIRLSYSWGVKLTRFMDGFTGYSYSNTISLSGTWHHWRGAIAYDNGGFTDNGELSLWYIDQYRRVGIASIGYTF